MNEKEIKRLESMTDEAKKRVDEFLKHSSMIDFLIEENKDFTDIEEFRRLVFYSGAVQVLTDHFWKEHQEEFIKQENKKSC